MKSDQRVEIVARGIANFILILGALSGVVLIIVGVVEDFNVLFLPIGIVNIISAIVFWVFVNLLVNISLKLDNPAVRVNGSSSRNRQELSNIECRNSNQAQVYKEHVAASNTVHKSDRGASNTEELITEDIENMILGEVLSGNLVEAKNILMTNGLTPDQALSYIESVKEGLK